MSEPIRRLELFTGAGRRRTWSDDEKAAIVAESGRPDVSVSAVARRHGLSPSQLFTWRRSARQVAMADRQGGVGFVPAVLMSAPTEPAPVEIASASCRRPAVSTEVEIEIGGAVVRIGAEARAVTITAVIRALKGSA